MVYKLEDQEYTPEFMKDHIELLHNMILGHMKNHNLMEWVVEPPETREFTGYLEFLKQPRKDEDYVNLVARMVHHKND